MGAGALIDFGKAYYKGCNNVAHIVEKINEM